jgi:putative addiction module component (TIGR02574 family)
MTIREQIAEQALALPPEDRTYLADLLEQSLTNGEFATSEIAAEWAAEIDRRIAAYDRGETKGVDAQKALERIRTRLSAHRSRKETP